MIVFEHIEKVYGDGARRVRALSGLDLAVRPGEFVAVCGPSGSGKSTLLHIMGLLDRPTSGRYLLGGRDVTALSDRELSLLRNRKIGFVFQGFHLLPRLTAAANVCLPLLYAGRRDAKRAAQQALERVGLHGREHHLPGELSGGEEQRVAIARAIVKEPEIILADEPTGNLDRATGKEILDLLSEIHRRGVTLVVITHDQAVAERAGRAVHLRDGAIEA